MTNNIRLRNWKAEDATQLTHIANNKKIWDNLRDAFPHPYSLQDAEIFINKMKDNNICLTIEYDGKVAGSISYHSLEDVERVSAEVGYFIGEDFWGKGILVEALRLLAAKVFAETEILRLFAIPYSFNAASMRVLEKAGWRKVGILKSGAIKNEKIVDLHYYELTKDMV